MRYFFVILSAFVFTTDTSAQLGKRWQIYFADNVDSLYTSSQYKITRTAYFHYPFFEQYPLFHQTIVEEGSNEKVNRAGILLNARSTKTFQFTGKAVYGNELDSVQIFYKMNAGIVRKGRSAMTSLMNLFSKEEDKSPQDEPSYNATTPVKNGYIEFEGKQFRFSTDTLFIGTDSIILKKIKKVIKPSTGKIKKANKYVYGMQLIKGDTCLAAMDENKWPFTLYLLKSLTYKERLVYTAFLTIHQLNIFNTETE